MMEPVVMRHYGRVDLAGVDIAGSCDPQWMAWARAVEILHYQQVGGSPRRPFAPRQHAPRTMRVQLSEISNGHSDKARTSMPADLIRLADRTAHAQPCRTSRSRSPTSQKFRMAAGRPK